MAKKQFDWENDETVKTWLEGLKSTYNYKRQFDLFMTWLRERQPELDTPTKLIEKRLADLKSDNPQDRAFFESLIVSFKIYLENEGNKENTIKSYLRSVRSFFSRNRLPLRFKRGELKVEEILEVRNAHKTKWIASNEELRAVYSVSRLEDRALLLTMYHTGLSSIDITELRVENFEDTVGKSRLYDEDGNWIGKGHIYLEKKREKTGVEVKTCLSEEAVHDIGLTLRKRGYPKKGLLLITRNNTQLSVRYINERLKKLVGQALGEEYGKQFQGSDLRDAYNDALLRADIKQEIKDLMFGHKREGAKSHYHASETTIREAYEKVFPYLSIDTVRRSREDIVSMKNQLLEANIEIQKLKTFNKLLLEKLEENPELRLIAQKLKELHL